MNVKCLIKWFASVSFMVATSLLGEWDLPIRVLIVFMVLDFLTGIGQAVINSELESGVGWAAFGTGAIKKIFLLVVIAIAHQLDLLLSVNHFLLRTMVCYFYVANEGISILENIGRAGVPLPKNLTSVMRALRDDSEKAMVHENYNKKNNQKLIEKIEPYSIIRKHHKSD